MQFFHSSPGPQGSFLVGHEVYTVLLANALTINEQPDLRGRGTVGPGIWGQDQHRGDRHTATARRTLLGARLDVPVRPKALADGKMGRWESDGVSYLQLS